MDISGPEVFGSVDPVDPDSRDLFQVVTNIASNLAAPATPASSTALAASLAELDSITGLMLRGVADVGTRAARVDRAQQINFDRQIALDMQLGETENIDLPNTIMRLKMQETGYQAALAATAKAIQPTLLDFLR